MTVKMAKCNKGYTKIGNKCLKTKTYNGSSNYHSVNTNYGIGFAGLLTILFIGLKLTGHVSWSWWWILSPLWISFLLGIILMIIFIGIFKFLDN